MKSFIIICLGLYGSWHFIDLSSDNTFDAAICPILFALFLIAAVIWLVTRGGFSVQTSDRGMGGGTDGGFFDGGDGGGCD
jgi:hypothetical protein